MNCCLDDFTRYSVELSTLLRHVMPKVPEVPHDMALDSVRQAYIQFARKSSILVTELVQDTQAGVQDYSIDPPEGYEVYMISGVPYGFTSPADHWGGNYYKPKYEVVDNRVIKLYNTPTVDEVGGLTVRTQLLPSSCCNVIPRSIEGPFGKGIAMGALADLLSIPNKPWTSLGLSTLKEREYNIAILDARNLADSNRQRGPLQAKRVRVL